MDLAEYRAAAAAARTAWLRIHRLVPGWPDIPDVPRPDEIAELRDAFEQLEAAHRAALAALTAESRGVPEDPTRAPVDEMSTS